MKTDYKGIALIKSFEGLYLKAYKCPAGVWTIGYGHIRNVREGQIISHTQADVFLRQDVEEFEKAVNSHGLKLNQNQFDALVSFTYNVGAGNFRSSTLLKKVKANPADSTIRTEFARWNKAKGKVLPGLIRRREAEANLYFEK